MIDIIVGLSILLIEIIALIIVWKKNNKLARIRSLETWFDAFGYPKYPYDDDNFNELGELLQGKAEWKRRSVEGKKVLQKLKDIK